MTIKVREKLLEFTDNLVMGIVNVTPDSFYEKSRVSSESDILHRAEKMLVEGADMLDIGGYSSRPGASEVSVLVEIERIRLATKALRKEFPNAVLSLDTFRSEVAEVGLNEGIDIINDISAGNLDPKLPPLVAKFGVPYIIMHMRGNPKTMASLTDYDNLMKEMISYFSSKINQFRALGIKDIVLDPGFGFSKTVDQNFKIVRNLSMLEILNCPILVGVSRKSFIQNTLNVSVENSLVGTNVLHTILLQHGANILRTHDVAETKQCVTLLKASRYS
jgi:dihydropteroate synthase|tara:strand:+ start:33383 stop:34210 length:828 start_codon:yes stop_codon:yes gene_type:complete